LLTGIGYVLSNVPLPEDDPLRQTTFICSSAVTEQCGPNNAIAKLSAEEDRVNVRLDDVPEVLVQAVLAAEDRDFFAHGGIDPVGIGRALFADLRNRHAKQGGSTITQQYVKTVYLSRERTVTRKVKEAVLAVKLERELTKKEILERYLNAVYFGRGAYGVQAAARAYFDKDVAGVSLADAAYLAGLIRSPESADASRDQNEATRRRLTVLDAMLDEGWVDQAAHDEAAAQPWTPGQTFRARTTKEGLGTVAGSEYGTEFFVEHVRQVLIAKYGEDVLYGGGLRVYTTIDLALQQAAYQAVAEVLDRPDDPAGALVAVDDKGEVKAMMGGRHFGQGEGETEVNYALGKRGGGSGRQAGSSFKPFVLATAVTQGVSVRSVFQAPGQIVLPKANNGADWKVRNYGGTPQGVLDIVGATKVSSNTVFAQLMLEVGPKNVVNLAHEMGIETDLPEVNSLVLGTGEVSPYEMASAYSTLARRGVHIDPTVITKVEQVDESGNVTVLMQASPASTRVLSEQESDIVTTCLQGVIQGGTGGAANIGRSAAGKTGTTQENRDAWFAGYTPKLTAVVWMGYPGGKRDEVTPPMDNVHGKAVTGGSFPAEIWARFMRNALEGVDSGTLHTVSSFPGTILNPTLELPTSTSSTSSTVAPASTSSTVKKKKPKPTTTTSVDPSTSSTDGSTTTSTAVVN
jgi:penicillin-binding protein 1A